MVPATLDDVAHPLSTLGHGTPQTREEALLMLGLPPGTDMTEGAIKTLVKRLRRRWHPDHAASIDDRASREQMMKQINAAWDIIAAR